MASAADNPMKRPAAQSAALSVVPAKQARTAGELIQHGGSANNKRLVSAGPSRTSSLHAPIMLLTGHEGEIYCGKFSPTGSILATAGYERKIFLWTVYDECENLAVLTGHGGAILELKFTTDGETLVSAASDKTAALWDLEAGLRIKRLKGHEKLINSVDVVRRGPQLLCTGSDDGTIRLWDRRVRGHTHSFDSGNAVTSVAFGDTGELVYSGGIDNSIQAWDLRRSACTMRLRGHSDTVTGLALSPDGNYLLSNGMDASLRVWDIRPYASQDRCLKILSGHRHSFEQNLLRCAWQPDGRRVTCGSSDRFVYVWDCASRQVVYKLPGHTGSVNETHFHPKEPIIMSVGSDKKVYLGEIEP
uniref:U5 small nuclear ribonucleoprotein 40 kDa protein n=3 Tax=Macrostomum lignano TaxID=282301 RepID=A0A1I8I3Y1_9PLAT